MHAVTLDDVRRALALPRPGREAQLGMSPRPRPGDVFPLPPDLQPREAGVLILLYPHDGDLAFFLTKRSDTVLSHKGQISFPGGAQEFGEALLETALRETREELGIQAPIEILGEPLTPVYIPVSGFRATPFVGYTPKRPDVIAEPGEVFQVIETPLNLILDDKNIREEEWNIRGLTAMVPYFLIEGHQVWGATAMMLGEFRELLRRSNGIS